MSTLLETYLTYEEDNLGKANYSARVGGGVTGTTTQIVYKHATINVCANDGDSCQLAEDAVPGMEYYITNTTEKQVALYPQSGDRLCDNGGVASKLYIGGHSTIHIKCVYLGRWNVFTSKEYLELVMSVSQTGTNAPSATVLENTTGQAVTPTYVSVGIFELTVPEALFNNDYTIVTYGSGNGQDKGVMVYRKTSTALRILSYSDFQTTLANSLLNSFPIVVRIYPSLDS